MRATDIKRALREAGIEIYRTRADEVHIAERVRENLIMDAGVRVRSDSLAVYFYARAEKSAFPAEAEPQLFNRARRCGADALERGYHESRTFVTAVTAPGDPDRTLDNWYHVQFEKPVTSIEAVLDEVRFACALAKSAKR